MEVILPRMVNVFRKDYLARLYEMQNLRVKYPASTASFTYVAEGLSGGCGCGDDNWGRYLEEITRAGADALAAASRAENAAYHAPTIIGGNWWVWDPEEDGYKDTGIPATGEGGGDCGCDAATDAEVEEMLDEIFGSRE